MKRHMNAKLIVRDRTLYEGGYISEVVIWSVPESVPPCKHGYKYRLFYGRPGERIIGYDNERGKGDHRHLRRVELSYQFVSIAKLLDDFEADITSELGENI